MKAWLLILSAIAAAGCRTSPSADAPASTPAAQGEAFARASCGGCHAITLYGSSPNPNAPPFGAIANQEGLTSETLSGWLHGAHNYPREMDFALTDAEADALTAYLLTLRTADYRRPTDY